jgi:hemerythrin superfamily protein
MGTPTIFEALRNDHDVQRELIDRLVETTGDSPERRELFARVAEEIAAHAAAEERYFYIPLMESDTTQDQARHAVSEHKELDDLVERLAGYDMTAPQWLLTARELRERLLHHLREEEREVFPVAGKVLDESEKPRLAAAYQADIARHRAA